MATLKEYFEFSQLAQASYALFNSGSALTVLQREGGFTASQAREFLGLDESGASVAGKGYTVVPNSHQPDDIITGFSATVFRNNATNKLTIALRGTDGLQDILQDVDLARDGYAKDQIYSLYNYIQRLTNTGTVAQWVRRYVIDEGGEAVPVWELTGTAQGLGIVPAGAQVDITGHSLGGHLAMAASRLFPSLVNQVYTYNAPGFLNNSTVNDFFASLGGASGFNGTTITNLYADAGREIITGLHTVPGPSLAVFIEDQGTGIPGNDGLFGGAGETLWDPSRGNAPTDERIRIDERSVSWAMRYFQENRKRVEAYRMQRAA